MLSTSYSTAIILLSYRMRGHGARGKPEEVEVDWASCGKDLPLYTHTHTHVCNYKGASNGIMDTSEHRKTLPLPVSEDG